MWLHEIVPGSPEEDALARKILTALYECAAAAQGCRLESITITKKEKTTELEGNVKNGAV